MNGEQTFSAERLLDSLNTAVIIIDPEFKVSSMNSAAELLLDISRKQAANRELNNIFPGCQHITEQLKKARDTQQIFAERNLVVTLHEGRKLTVDCTVTPISEEPFDGYLAIELTQIDRRLRISREDQLLNQGEGSRELLRGVAHEIKNPLGGILGAAQLLSAELENQELTEYTDVIIHEVDRLQNLVDRMLGPRQLPKMESVNVHEVLEKVFALIRAEAAPETVMIRDYDPSLPLIKVDREMIQQALLNLAGNALQAVADQDFREIRFRTRAIRHFTIGDTVHRLVLKVDVIDNGGGVAPEMQERIFLPMITDKPDGSGLGLSIAQSLIQRHGGLVECECNEEQTCFSVFLPIDVNNGESGDGSDR
ncbi:MAG: PAS domain-containing protein [Gammaproteobacteria bacterium]|nr:MAG: PAS domain-containing protein [Gammaproteobacteria bacterium]